MNNNIDPVKTKKILNVIINILSVIAGAIGTIFIQGCIRG